MAFGRAATIRHTFSDLEETMGRFGEELSRVSIGATTFFFNKKKARNGEEYLQVVSMYGNPPNYNRINVFESQLVSFKKHFNRAIDEVIGVEGPAELEGAAGAEEPEVPTCPTCGTSGWDLTYKKHEGNIYWAQCPVCGEGVPFDNEQIKNLEASRA